MAVRSEPTLQMLAGPIRHSRFGGIKGRQAVRGADSPQGFPLEASAAPQARRREGLKPNGRDDKDGTGRSPKARRRFAPTRSKV